MKRTVKRATNGSGEPLISGTGRLSLDPPRSAVPLGSAILAKRLAVLREDRDAIQRQIDAYEFVLRDVAEVKTEAKRGRASAMVQQAIGLERQRRVTYPSRAAKLAARQAALDGFLRTHPQPFAMRALEAALEPELGVVDKAVYHHLLRARGYRATGTTSTARWAPATRRTTNTTKTTTTPRRGANRIPTNGHASKMAAQRAKGLAFLAQFSTETPFTPAKRPDLNRVGVYVRRGYLEASEDGWTRTDKVFEA